MTANGAHSSSSFWRQVAREPLVHFLVLGGLLFALGAWFRDNPTEQIVVTEAKARQLWKDQESLLGRPLTAEERAQTIRTYIEDEILVREARRQGLDRDDTGVRQRLLRKMRYSLDEPVDDPPPEQLRAFYEENIDKYRTPAAVSLTHVFYSEEKFRELDDPQAVLRQLQAGADPTQFGESFWLGRDLKKHSRADLVQIFGSEFADALEGKPVGQWFGPLKSRRGYHFVKITARHAPEAMPFEAVQPYLVQEYLFAKQQEAVQRKIERMRRHYRVVVDPKVEAQLSQTQATARVETQP